MVPKDVKIGEISTNFLIFKKNSKSVKRAYPKLK